MEGVWLRGSSVNSIKSALTNEVIQVGSDIAGTIKGGTDVALSDDGNTLISSQDNYGSGSSLVYKWDGSSWSQIGSSVGNFKTAGGETDISGDGSKLIVGGSQQGHDPAITYMVEFKSMK